MNRPTIDIEELLDAADEAMAAYDYTLAVEILRKATTVAPLRRDIRNRLALALERSPVKPKKAVHVSEERVSMPYAASDTSEYQFENDDSELDPFLPEPENSGRDAIGQIARKAFAAAAGQTARAGEATRNLSNLLQQGIKTWKSSLAEPQPVRLNAPAAIKAEVQIPGPQQNVFTPESDLSEYLRRAEEEEHPDLELDNQDSVLNENDTETNRLTRPVQVSAKTASATPRKKSQKPADVEDVLAAGIGGLIEAASTVDKKKVGFAIIYAGMIGLFGFACFDVSKKFPDIDALPGQNYVQSASLGSLNLTETMSADTAISESRVLAAAGKKTEAITLLQSNLESGNLLRDRDLIRVELAALLNDVAEQHLRGNQFADSVDKYRQAVTILPSDSALQLRLGNALYYMGTLGSIDAERKNQILSEAAGILEKLTAKSPDNMQAFRLSALVAEARGDKSAAKQSWTKVKALATADSAESKEADSYLK